MSKTGAWVIAEQERAYRRWLDAQALRDEPIAATDPESLPGHDYATESEYRAYLDEVCPLATSRSAPTGNPDV